MSPHLDPGASGDPPSPPPPLGDAGPLRKHELEALLQHTEERLRLLRWSEPRTGLLRHELFLDRLGQAAAGVARGGASFALLMIGTAHTDAQAGAHTGTPKHPVGVDTQAIVMQALALRLCDVGRRSDSYAQFGRSCFVALLMGNSSLTGSVAMAQKIAESLEQPMEDAGHHLVPSVSIGVALCPQHGHDAHAMLLAAHDALDHSMRSGRLVSVHAGPKRLPGQETRPAGLTGPA